MPKDFIEATPRLLKELATKEGRMRTEEVTLLATGRQKFDNGHRFIHLFFLCHSRGRPSAPGDGSDVSVFPITEGMVALPLRSLSHWLKPLVGNGFVDVVNLSPQSLLHRVFG